MTGHLITIGPSADRITDSKGRVSPLPRPRENAHRARCTCGWRSAEYATEEQARTIGKAHVRVAVRSS